LNEDWELQVPLRDLEDLGFDWVHLPCPDYFSPTVDEIDLGIWPVFDSYNQPSTSSNFM
jgi:hypothetical protein